MITKQNYETWFLLYVDNELSAEEQAMVMNFVSLYPDFKSEFEFIQQMKLRSDTSVVMPGKEKLKSEFEQLEVAYRFDPDLSIVYPNKQELYRKTRMILFPKWASYAAAASVMLMLGIFWLVFEKSDSPKEAVVKANPVVNRTSIDVKKEIDQNQVSEQPTAIVVKQSAITKLYKQVAASNESIDPSLLVSSEVSVSDFTQEIIQPESTVLSEAQSNFSKEVLDAANERMKATPISVVSIASSPSPNMEVLIKTSVPQENESTPFKGLLRMFSRKVLHEGEDEDIKVIQVANFHIHVKN